MAWSKLILERANRASYPFDLVSSRTRLKFWVPSLFSPFPTWLFSFSLPPVVVYLASARFHDVANRS